MYRDTGRAFVDGIIFTAFLFISAIVKLCILIYTLVSSMASDVILLISFASSLDSTIVSVVASGSFVKLPEVST